MMLGLADYVEKNRFPGVVILGLSGGIDSALSAAVAVDALGADRVRAVMMPSPYTSRDSLEDAAECARLLGIRLDNVSIEPAMRAFGEMLAPIFEGRAARHDRGEHPERAPRHPLMAISNKFGHMVLSTGNKSEMSVGYATLYGDMCGGYSVLKDVYKTTVYRAVALAQPVACRRWGSGPPGASCPSDDPHAGAHRRAEARSDRPGFAAALRSARRHSRMPDRTRSGDRGYRRPRPQGRDGRQGLADAGHRRVQAPAGAAGRQDHQPRLRPRPSLSDHQPLPSAHGMKRGPDR